MARIATANRTASTRFNSIIYNGDFEVKPAYTADTNTANKWIDGTAAGSASKLAYGWSAPSAGSGVGANGAIAFDTSQFRSGLASLRLSNLNASGAVTASSLRAATPGSSTAFELFPMLPNVSYILTGYIRTNNVAASSAFIDIRQFSSALTSLTTTSTNKLSGTDVTWRQVTLTFTSNASAAFGCPFLRNNVAGNTSDAWFDDITLIPATTGRTVIS